MKSNGCFSYLLVFVISIAAAIILTAVFDGGADASDTSDLSGDVLDTEEKWENEHDFDENGFYYAQLSSEEKRIYRTLLVEVANGVDSITFDNVDYENYHEYCVRAIAALSFDHPELFWLQNGCKTTSSHFQFSSVGSVKLDLYFYSFWEYNLNKSERVAELDAAVDAVAELARAYSEDYDRIQFVHDYLIENAIYDHDALAEYYKSNHDADCEYIYSAYGCLVDGRTVCAGYAKAFKLIMDELGYDCAYVTGDAGGAHAWNLIFIENEGYYVDVTWDDADHEYDEAKYEYFCINDESLSKTHTTDEMFDMPECDAEKYNYFKYRGYFLESYDFDSINDVLTDQAGQHIVSVQFASPDVLNDACVELVDSGACYSIDAFEDYESIRCSVNEDHCTLTFYLN